MYNKSEKVQKSANFVFNILLFNFGALVLMLLNIFFSKIALWKDVVPTPFILNMILNLHQIQCKLSPNIMQICAKLHQKETFLYLLYSATESWCN